MDNIAALSAADLDGKLSEVTQLRRHSLREDVAAESIVALDNAARKLTEELRRREL